MTAKTRLLVPGTIRERVRPAAPGPDEDAPDA